MCGYTPDLADEPELVEPLEERRPDRRALADQRQRLGVLESPASTSTVLVWSFQDRHAMASHLVEALERPDRVLIVVEPVMFMSPPSRDETRNPFSTERAVVPGVTRPTAPRPAASVGAPPRLSIRFRAGIVLSATFVD